MQKMKVTRYGYFGDVGNEVDLEDILKAIKNGQFKEEIEHLRSIKDKEEYGELKKQLPHFTPSGTFDGRRKENSLSSYNSVIILDIDKLEGDELFVRDRAGMMENTYAAFLSPGGQGVKILVKVDTDSESHRYAFDQVASLYEEALGIEVDQSGKDISRACFVSYDPKLYINENALEFQVSISEPPVFMDNSLSAEMDDFRYIVDFTDKIITYVAGDRNNYIYQLANNFNRAGKSKHDAESFIRSNYPQLDREIRPTISSAYKNTDEHGKFSTSYMQTASSASLAPTARKRDVNTPTIPDEIRKNLPDLLQKGVAAFVLDREKDIFLTSAFTVLSGCFSKINGIYDGRDVFANLNCFIIAGPGNGKSASINSRDLAAEIHSEITAKFELNKSLHDDTNQVKHQRSLFVAADSSAAAVKRNLNLNSGRGIICETEADTLGATLGQEWGEYSDIIRKAFHHEPISYSRMGEKGDINIEEIDLPRISMCLTGTPNQASGLIKSTEDGLFSRILFYTFRNEEAPFFKNVFRKEGVVSYTAYFKKLATVVYNNYKRFESMEQITFSLSEMQGETFVRHFDKMVKRICNSFGNETDLRSVVNRLGLITFRIAMVLTIIRNFDNDDLSDTLKCCDKDFNSSIQLSSIYLEHSLAVFRSLPKATETNSRALLLYEFLPKKFQAKEAEVIGAIILDYGKRSISNYLKELKQKELLKQPKKNGIYIKC
ncbi:DUF3987 domain-containing protein [Draconibacterium sp. IB214405]|uniref:DUF3987 domain-containing protein n=1 Tax=Draconibacterium sp. IB214405 TaxID=3097352 RepID=UPI002A115F58|nr:DUF3987 domain-containing protein [Draconibacterium sp. IB214405]MDX8338767.1 DUF3987 domain-containing protein [Draconibacterium sp. IB214405]